MLTLAEQIIKNAGINYTRDVDIAGLSTVGVHSVAAFFVMPESTEELVNLLRLLHLHGIKHKVVGGMSNLLPRNELYDGVLINTRKINRKSVAENEVFAECGARLAAVVRILMQYRLGGMSQLYHIPGTLGGSVRGNAGAHGLEISDVLKSANIYIPSLDKVVTLSNSQMCFGYRSSALKGGGGVLLSAILSAVPCEKDKTELEIEHFRNLRKSQPNGVRSCGSTFKRYKGISAGWYIDRCGLKGVSVGDAAVSELHAGFIINRGNATADDFLTLIDYIKRRVFSEFGILLEEEIDYL